jgi:hypothetical protein
VFTVHLRHSMPGPALSAAAKDEKRALG